MISYGQRSDPVKPSLAIGYLLEQRDPPSGSCLPDRSGRKKIMTQKEIEARLERLQKQLSELVAHQQSRNRRRYWIGGISLMIGLGYLLMSTVWSIDTVGPAGIPLLFVWLALYACEMEKLSPMPRDVDPHS